MQLQSVLQPQPSQALNLIDALAVLADRPLEFVLWAYPWGQPGVLRGDKGPDEWQVRELVDIGHRCGDGGAVLKALKSGHEVGKTALAAWIIHWFISTRPQPQIVATANTKTQLETKLWRELAKWHNLARPELHARHKWTATKFYNANHPDTWFAAAIPWNKDKPEAFQGTHERDVLIVYDESSAIDDAIWEATEGSLSPRSIWLCTGNPTLNTGRFYECFNRYRHRWAQSTIDSRTASHANQDRINQWIQDYGEDSDFVRIRVKGEFPRVSSAQFIPTDLVEAARVRKLDIPSFQYAPILIGVDVARFGDDQSVILVRQGGHIEEIKRYREIDTMQLVGYVSEAIIKYKTPTTFVDEVGIGAGVIDRLRQLGFKVIGVNSGRTAIDDRIHANLRAEMWSKMRTWLETGSIPDDKDLIADLIGPEYGFDRQNRFQLERKEEMKSRGLASPDAADALALTFAVPTYSNADIILQEELMSKRNRQDQYISLDPDAGW